MLQNVIEIDSKCIYLDQVVKGLFRKKLKTDSTSSKINNGVSIDGINIDMKSRKIHFLISGEKIFVKLIKIPKVKRKNLRDMVNEEMKCYFKNMQNIIYSFDVYEEHEMYVDVIVFCVNWSHIDVFNKLIENKNDVRGVWVIQLCFLVHFMKYINKKNFIFIFQYKKDLYFVACKNKVLIYNDIIHNFDYNKLIYYLDDFLNEIENTYSNNKQKHIYFANFSNQHLIKDIFPKYYCKYLGELDRDNLIKTFI